MLSQKDLEKIWSAVPPDYYQRGVKENILQQRWHMGKLKAVLALSPAKPAAVLDVGCASGWFLSQITRKFPKIKAYGIDPYEAAITYGSKKYKNLTLAVADAHQIPFPDNSFDFVICTEVLEHVKDPEKVLHEIARVLKPSGTAVIEMDSGNVLFQLAWYWWTHLRHGVWEHAHIQVFNSRKLQSMIQGNGFLIQKKVTFNFSMAVAFRAKKRLPAA